MKAFAEAFYKGRAWKRSRGGFIAHRRRTDGGLCQRCRKELGYIVHHKVELTPENINDPEISLSWSNFEYLCKSCHDIEHGYCGRAEQPLLQFDDNGDPIAPPGRRSADLLGDR